MNFFTWVGLCIVIYCLIYVICLCVFDCDLQLAFAEYFGKRLGIYPFLLFKLSKNNSKKIVADKLRGKVIWVTEALSPVGEEMAYQIAQNSGKLVISGKKPELLNEIKKRCLQMNKELNDDDILVLPLTMTQSETHQDCFNSVVEHFGTIDIIINNVGLSQRARWEYIESKVDHQIFELNVFSVVNLTRIAIKYFNGKGKGRLAVMSSIAGLIGVPYTGSFSATKHALHVSKQVKAEKKFLKII